jgi:hypothetical protein
MFKIQESLRLNDILISPSQLEMERALLEGEHQTEMERLQDDQEKIRHLRHKQNMLMEKASREREKVRVTLDDLMLVVNMYMKYGELPLNC